MPTDHDRLIQTHTVRWFVLLFGGPLTYAIVRYHVFKGVEFGLLDLAEIVIGATVLAIPVAYTEEVWILGEEISNLKASMVFVVSLLFTAAFTYAVFYRDHFKGYGDEFVKRLLSGYLVTLTIAALILFLVDKLPLFDDPGVALRRMILVAFPATFSATVVDSLK